MATIADSGAAPRRWWKIWKFEAAAAATPVPAPIEAVLLDLSLHSNGDTYIDQDNESARLINRIERSISSVVGLAGVRGAGKSSLAKRVLSACEDKGYFTLLIPSPTAYEPREFLISVFQRTAEACAKRLNDRIWGGNDPARKGARAVRDSRRKLLFSVTATMALIVAAAGAMIYFNVTAQSTQAATRLQAQLTYLAGQSASIRDILSTIQPSGTTSKTPAMPTAGSSSRGYGPKAQYKASDSAFSKPAKSGPANSSQTPADNDAQSANQGMMLALTGEGEREIQAGLLQKMRAELSAQANGAQKDVAGEYDFQAAYDTSDLTLPAASFLRDALSKMTFGPSDPAAPPAANAMTSAVSAAKALAGDATLQNQARVRTASLIPISERFSLSGIAVPLPTKDASAPPTLVTIPSYSLDRIESTTYSRLLQFIDGYSKQLTDQSAGTTPFKLIEGYLQAQRMAVLLYGGLGMAAILIAAFGFRRAVRLANNYRVQRRYERDVGLVQKCDEFIDRLQYETTQTTGSEIGFVANLFSGKLSSERQRSDRPLSLPSMTAACTEFLDNIATAFNGKVVICIDELDKITVPQQLLDLLKGVKGILGSDNTHFILTVSEDAMAMFKERRGGKRTMVESAFEEIVYLDRLNFDIAQRISERALVDRHDDAADRRKLAALFWVFGAGVPREIKRCILQNVFSRPDSGPFGIWQALFLEMLNNLSIPGGDENEKSQALECDFLQAVEAIKARTLSLPATGADYRGFRDFVGGAVSPWLGRNRDEALPSHSAKNDMPLPFLPAATEILIGAACLGIATGDIVLFGSLPGNLNLLIDTYKYIPQNPRYAFHCLQKFAPAL